MRLLVLFDLPVVKREDRKNASEFRNFLLKDGYDMMQYSVYCRICNGSDAIEKHQKRLMSNLPSKGSVRAMVITEKQYSSMRFLVGSQSKKDKRVCAGQLSIF